MYVLSFCYSDEACNCYSVLIEYENIVKYIDGCSKEPTEENLLRTLNRLENIEQIFLEFDD